MFAPGSGVDTIDDFHQGNAVSSAYNSPDHDKIDLRACHTSFAALTISEETPGGNAVIQLPGSGNSITLDGVTSSQVMANQADFFLFT